jgi:hypothetical protein
MAAAVGIRRGTVHTASVPPCTTHCLHSRSSRRSNVKRYSGRKGHSYGYTAVLYVCRIHSCGYATRQQQAAVLVPRLPVLHRTLNQQSAGMQQAVHTVTVHTMMHPGATRPTQALGPHNGENAEN